MEEQISGNQNIIERIFSNRRRAAGVLALTALLLAIPFTLSLISQQQDIRQRALEIPGTQTAIDARITSSASASFDLNDDGAIEELDLNIMLSSFRIRRGD